MNNTMCQCPRTIANDDVYMESYHFHTCNDQAHVVDDRANDASLLM